MISQPNTPETPNGDAASQADDDLFVDTPPGIIKSMKAYLRELPTLLANPKYDRCCVVYHGDERIGIAKSERDLARECLKRGLREDECYFGIIAKQDPDEWIGLDRH
jgi:hypothetical protein